MVRVIGMLGFHTPLGIRITGSCVQSIAIRRMENVKLWLAACFWSKKGAESLSVFGSSFYPDWGWLRINLGFPKSRIGSPRLPDGLRGMGKVFTILKPWLPQSRDRIQVASLEVIVGLPLSGYDEPEWNRGCLKKRFEVGQCTIRYPCARFLFSKTQKWRFLLYFEAGYLELVKKIDPTSLLWGFSAPVLTNNLNTRGLNEVFQKKWL